LEVIHTRETPMSSSDSTQDELVVRTDVTGGGPTNQHAEGLVAR
jgi:mannose/fructose-specific phosphotransferase system component IIA